jgi:hypothetical protein
MCKVWSQTPLERLCRAGRAEIAVQVCMILHFYLFVAKGDRIMIRSEDASYSRFWKHNAAKSGHRRLWRDFAEWAILLKPFKTTMAKDIQCLKVYGKPVGFHPGHPSPPSVLQPNGVQWNCPMPITIHHAIYSAT